MLEPHLTTSSDGLSYGHPGPRTGRALGTQGRLPPALWSSKLQGPRVGSFATTALWLPPFIFHSHASQPESLLLSVGPLICPHACSLPAAPFPGPHFRLGHLLQVRTTEPRFFFSSLGTPSLPNSRGRECGRLTPQHAFSPSSGGDWAAGLPGQPGEDTGETAHTVGLRSQRCRLLATHFQLPERGENKCLSLKPPSLGCLVMVALAN